MAMECGSIDNLGRGAEVMRDKGRRMIATRVHDQRAASARQKSASDPLDTLMSHAPEASELRALVNLSLCYGARGIHYYWLGNYINHMRASTIRISGSAQRFVGFERAA